MMGAERLTGCLEHITSIANGAIDSLRQVPEYTNLPIIVAIEAMSNDCLYLAREILDKEEKRGKQTLILSERRAQMGMMFGVMKNEAISAMLADHASTFLSMHQIEISPKLIALSTSFVERRKTPRDLVLQIGEQLKNYRQDLRTHKYSGKHAGPDDLCIAFMMAPTWMTYFCGSQKKEYTDFKDRFALDIWHTISPERVVQGIEPNGRAMMV